MGILADDGSSTLETVEMDGETVYKDTVVTIPKGVSENDAMSTAAACLVGIHCGVPSLEGVGGGEAGFYSGKVRNVVVFGLIYLMYVFRLVLNLICFFLCFMFFLFCRLWWWVAMNMLVF